MKITILISIISLYFDLANSAKNSNLTRPEKDNKKNQVLIKNQFNIYFLNNKTELSKSDSLILNRFKRSTENANVDDQTSQTAPDPTSLKPNTKNSNPKKKPQKDQLSKSKQNNNKNPKKTNNLKNKLNQVNPNNKKNLNKKYKIDKQPKKKDSKKLSKNQKSRYAKRNNEIKRIEKETGFKVNGKTHEFEHPIGVKILLQKNFNKKNKNQKIGIAKKLHDSVPAYFEVKELHKAHPGKGSGKVMNNYREKISSLIKNGKLGEALIENQKEYAKMKNFKDLMETDKGKAATNSFNNMIKQNPTFEILDSNNKKIKLKLTPEEQVSLYLIRQEAINGKPSTKQNILDAKKFLGIND